MGYNIELCFLFFMLGNKFGFVIEDWDEDKVEF